MYLKDHYYCDCEACEFAVEKEYQANPKPIIAPKQVQLIQEKDFGLLLKKLQAPNKLTRSVRIRIPETIVFMDGQMQFLAYYDEGEGYIKFINKLTLQQARQFLLEKKTSDFILIKYFDNNVQVSSNNELLHIIMKRKIDIYWQQLLFIQNFWDSNSELYHFDFNYKRHEKSDLFDQAKIEILILNGEIHRASSDFVPITKEEEFEKSLTNEEYCRYMTFKMVHYIEVFGFMKILEARFSFNQRTFVSVEKMDTLHSHRMSYFDSEILLKRKKIENEDDLHCQRIIENYIKEERERAIKVYKNVLKMDSDNHVGSYITRNKLAAIGFDISKQQERLEYKFQNIVLHSKDPLYTLQQLIQEEKKIEDKVQKILKDQ